MSQVQFQSGTTFFIFLPCTYSQKGKKIERSVNSPVLTRDPEFRNTGTHDPADRIRQFLNSR